MNDCVYSERLEKTGGKHSSVQLWKQRKLTVFPTTPNGRKGTTRFWGRYLQDVMRKRQSVAQLQRRCKETKIYEPHFRVWAPKGGPYNRRNSVDKHVRTTTVNQGENSRSVSVRSFSSYCLFLSAYRGQISFSRSFSQWLFCSFGDCLFGSVMVSSLEP